LRQLRNDLDLLKPAAASVLPAAGRNA